MFLELEFSLSIMFAIAHPLKLYYKMKVWIDRYIRIPKFPKKAIKIASQHNDEEAFISVEVDGSFSVMVEINRECKKKCIGL